MPSRSPLGQATPIAAKGKASNGGAPCKLGSARARAMEHRRLLAVRRPSRPRTANTTLRRRSTLEGLDLPTTRTRRLRTLRGVASLRRVEKGHVPLPRGFRLRATEWRYPLLPGRPPRTPGPRGRRPSLAIWLVTTATPARATRAVAAPLVLGEKHPAKLCKGVCTGIVERPQDALAVLDRESDDSSLECERLLEKRARRLTSTSLASSRTSSSGIRRPARYAEA